MSWRPNKSACHAKQSQLYVTTAVIILRSCAATWIVYTRRRFGLCYVIGGAKLNYGTGLTIIRQPINCHIVCVQYARPNRNASFEIVAGQRIKHINWNLTKQYGTPLNVCGWLWPKFTCSVRSLALATFSQNCLKASQVLFGQILNYMFNPFGQSQFRRNHFYWVVTTDHTLHDRSLSTGRL